MKTCHVRLLNPHHAFEVVRVPLSLLPLFSPSLVHLARTLAHARRSTPFQTPFTPAFGKNQQAIIDETQNFS